MHDSLWGRCQGVRHGTGCRQAGNRADGGISRGSVQNLTMSRAAAFGRWLALGFTMSLCAGCGLSSFTSGLGGSGGGVFGSKAGGEPGAAAVSEDQLLAAARGEGTYSGSLGEMSANCPRVTLP